MLIFALASSFQLMSMKKILIFSALIFICAAGNTQTLTGSQLLENSIRHHDLKERWEKAKLQFHLTETRPGGAGRNTVLQIDNRKGVFFMKQTFENYSIRREVTEKSCEGSLHASDPLANQEMPKPDLSCERCKLLRNYYTYLWGLPMKLKDPGTHVVETVENGEFTGQRCLILKVTYDETVGKDAWYFYFDKTTYALTGYRFYHDEANNDGEYIMLDGEEVINSIRFPKKRSWYLNADGKFLGADILEN